ncbi:MAG: hypothetical protein IT473_00580 [Lysobacter sp.]|nr:hypothetical protein [Lysobacter sp.]
MLYRCARSAGDDWPAIEGIENRNSKTAKNRMMFMLTQREVNRAAMIDALPVKRSIDTDRIAGKAIRQ